ncbi:MAG: LLM class flavin-dependent oxidoreductase [Pseudomonadota bacterium]
MDSGMPAVSLAAMPGRRQATLDAAKRIDELGFEGIYCPSLSDAMGLCTSLAMVTERVHFGTSIAPIYWRPTPDYAQAAGYIHELSNGRFRFGIGVSHGPARDRMGVTAGKPLSDIRQFVDEYRAVPRTGEKAPVILATLRKKMIALAGEIGDGMVFANAARSHMEESLSALPEAKRNDPNFFIGNMIPTCITDDLEAAKATNRRTLTGYALLPNYRNYWKEAGYVEEMEAVERCVAAGETDRVAECLSDRWLADTTIFGTPDTVYEEVEKSYAAGVTPILVPSSAAGNQMAALDELFTAFAR